MKEIRLHGRGGQGVVKAAQIIVKTAVETGKHAHFIPFFGVERKGSPVYGFLRIDDKPIRVNMQVYTPEILLVFDDTLPHEGTYQGLQEGGIVIINTKKPLEELGLPKEARKVVTVDATGISMKLFGKNIPNTAMLGAFAKGSGIVDTEILYRYITETFGEKNTEAAKAAFAEAVCVER